MKWYHALMLGMLQALLIKTGDGSWGEWIWTVVVVALSAIVWYWIGLPVDATDKEKP